MAVIAFTSLHGSPGTTSLAVAVAHHWSAVTQREPVLVEADIDGGVIAARHQLGLVPGLTELAGTARLGIDADDIVGRAQRFGSGVAVVPAHPSSDRTQAALRAAAGHLAHAFSDLVECDVLIDAGRVRPGSPVLPLLDTASRLVVVVRPDAECLVTTMHRLDLLAQYAPLDVVAIGTKPYGAGEVAAALGVPTVEVVPHDADAVRNDPAAAKARRKGWVSAVRSVTEHLAAQIATAVSPVA
jgi:MinD-like ATPase involved in chromosome partitioning or flagellar assembly